MSAIRRFTFPGALTSNLVMETALAEASRLTAGPNDLQLAQLAAAGDTGAFDVLMQRHHACVFRLALRALGNREEAEDVQQETFVQAYRKLRSFRGDASFRTWVCAIAVRLCLSRNRRVARRPVQVISQPEVEAAPAADPQEQLAAMEVQQALAKLSPPDRMLLVLKCIEGLEHEEIARVLGCSVESSRSRLSRAKRLFREQFVGER
jgi:RNA polymerase sigma-70 factor (ECF subfamily)